MRCFPIAVVFTLLLSGCGYDTFTEPSGDRSAPAPQPNLSLNDLAEFFADDWIDMPEGAVIGGRVTSSDSAGNFYKSIFIQQDTTAVELLTGVYDNYVSYRRGAYITVELGGLRLARANGVLQIGAPASGSEREVEDIASEAILRRIVRRAEEAPDSELEIPTFTIPEIGSWMAGRLIRVTGGSFTQGANAVWSGERTYSRERGTSIRTYTSPYASFAGELLPAGEVDLVGIVTLYRDQLQIKLSSPEDVYPTL